MPRPVGSNGAWPARRDTIRRQGEPLRRAVKAKTSTPDPTLADYRRRHAAEEPAHLEVTVIPPARQGPILNVRPTLPRPQKTTDPSASARTSPGRGRPPYTRLRTGRRSATCQAQPRRPVVLPCVHGDVRQARAPLDRPQDDRSATPAGRYGPEMARGPRPPARNHLAVLPTLASGAATNETGGQAVQEASQRK